MDVEDGYQTLYAKVGSDLDRPSRSKSTSPRVEYSFMSADAKGLVEDTTTISYLFENRRSKSVPAGCCRSESNDAVSDGVMWFESELVDYSCMKELREVEQASEGASSAVIEYLTRGIMSEPCHEDYSINHAIDVILSGQFHGMRLPSPGEQDFDGLVEYCTKVVDKAKLGWKKLAANVGKIEGGLKEHVQVILEQRVMCDGSYLDTCREGNDPKSCQEEIDVPENLGAS